MSRVIDVVQGALKSKGLLEATCVKDLNDLLSRIPELFTIEIPSSVSNVVVSAQQPGDDERQSLWVRLNNSGGFIGIYIYSEGVWELILPWPNQLVRMYGASDDLPKGFILATDSLELDASQKNFLKGQWHWKNDDPSTEVYDIFDAIFVGF